jgi:hypothetical protein
LAEIKYSYSDKLAIWLACAASILAILLFLIEKTPVSVVVLLVLILALTVYPILCFAKSPTARAICLIGTLLGTIALGRVVWPKAKLPEVAAQTPSQSPGQQNSQPGNNNNVNQTGDNNTAVKGSNNNVGNTYNIQKASNVVQGWLVPEHKPTPRNGCNLDANDFVVFFGNIVASTTDSTVPIVRIQGHDLLKFQRDTKGRLAFSGEVFNELDDAVVVIEKNKFTISDEAFQIDNPNRSSLKVTVKHLNEPVLDIEYLNSHALKIKGHFHFQGVDIKATDGSITTIRGAKRATGTITGESCIASNGFGIIGFY